MISYNEVSKKFTINTPNTSYFLGIDADGVLRNLYYGEKLNSAEDVDFINNNISNYHSNQPPRIEYISREKLVYHEPCIFAQFPDGTRDLRLRYKDYEIVENGKQHRLSVTLEDEFYDFEVTLNYTVYEGLDLISKNAVIKNMGTDEVKLSNMKSGTLYPKWYTSLKLLHLSGTWNSEFQKQIFELDKQGKFTLDNTRGVCASHQHVPFFALGEKDTNETSGRVWYGVLHWSGDFTINFETSFDKQVTVSAGVNNFDTFITLSGGECYETPLFTVGFTNGGYEEMSRTLYDYQYDYLLPQSKIKNIFPVIYNTWYPYQFDVNEEKCLGFIEKAKEIGAELFVIDDGWFGRRKKENDGLGDWWHDPDKFPNGLKPVSDKAHELGMLFGLWVEPEMVNPASDLYKQHPDWVLSFPNRENTQKRFQYVLNLAREDVMEFCWSVVDRAISQYDLDYLKWDLNSYISESGTELGNMRIKYIENLYEIWRRMNEKYPHVLFENCASGAGRADYGMSAYCDRINRSDNADSVDVLKIHEGFSMIFPPRLAGGAGNICTSPYFMNKRCAPLKFRSELGMTGSMSVGINILTAPKQELDEIKRYMEIYKSLRHITQNSYLYRLSSMYDSNMAVWEYLSRDGREAVVFVFAHGLNYRQETPRILLRGLDKDAMYSISGESVSLNQLSTEQRKAHGDSLMSFGISCKPIGDYYSQIVRIKKI